MTNTDPLSPEVTKLHMWSLFKLDGAGGERVLDRVSLSNGLAWNSKLGKMYYIDSLAKTVDSLTFNADNGEVGDRHTIFNITDSGLPGFLDGMTIDTR